MMSGTSGGFLHAAFGLRLRSALALPELARLADDRSPPDVTIELGRVPAQLEHAFDLQPAVQVTDRRFQLDVPAGRFRVTEGRRVVIQPGAGASEADLRPYLLGTVMGALCLQRALLPLHAAAVLFGDAAVAFAGASGAGKSSLAAEFLSRGFGILADDLLAVEIRSEGAPGAFPGLARIRLRSDAPGAAGKTSLPTAPVAAGAWPVRRFYRLCAGGAASPEIRRLRGPEAVSAILDQVYRRPIAASMGREAGCFAQCVGMAGRCEAFDVSFDHASSSPAALAQILEAHLA